MRIDGDLAELFGIHIGDGCISRTERYAEYYLGGDLKEEKEYHDNWVGPLFNKKIMRPLLRREVVYKEHPKVGVYAFYLFNETIVSFFEKFGICAGSKINIKIPSQIKNNQNLSKRFLRGLFDTDGSLYFDKNRSSKNPNNDRPQIKLGSVSKTLIYEVFDLLRNLGFHPRFKKPYKGKRDKNTVYSILIYRVMDLEYFMKVIGFKNPKHYTKWQLFKKNGYCLPHTSLRKRKELLKNFIKDGLTI